ncbi:MAG: flavodoxin family protein [Deltaproteobacteria bacterium]|nr:flavodoxin family protein [Deltaproteobacteria bacterium]
MVRDNDDVELKVRTGSPSVRLTRDEFRERFRAQFVDPAFERVATELAAVEAIAWDGYDNHRKAPRTRAAGPGFADPTYELSLDWLAARDAIREAQRLHDRSEQLRILVINGSARSEQTCPAEISKTFRLAAEASDELRTAGCHVDLLDLSNLASEYGRKIHPCKACVSTAMPLCHWPCSCYPNHSLGQTQDWMNEIYPRWVAAHAVVILAPVYWYQAPSPLKLMLDRLVCADGGNPDPTTTRGKDPAQAKALELAGWGYPRHLEGRVFSVIVHGDYAGADTLRRQLHDTLTDMNLEPAGVQGDVDRQIGYLEPYATSHEALDRDPELVTEVRNAMRVLVTRTAQLRGGLPRANAEIVEPRPK